jgi:hypothetical protein
MELSLASLLMYDGVYAYHQMDLVVNCHANDMLSLMDLNANRFDIIFRPCKVLRYMV